MDNEEVRPEETRRRVHTTVVQFACLVCGHKCEVNASLAIETCPECGTTNIRPLPESKMLSEERRQMREKRRTEMEL